MKFLYLTGFASKRWLISPSHLPRTANAQNAKKRPEKKITGIIKLGTTHNYIANYAEVPSLISSEI